MEYWICVSKYSGNPIWVEHENWLELNQWTAPTVHRIGSTINRLHSQLPTKCGEPVFEVRNEVKTRDSPLDRILIEILYYNTGNVIYSISIKTAMIKILIMIICYNVPKITNPNDSQKNVHRFLPKYFIVLDNTTTLAENAYSTISTIVNFVSTKSRVAI